MYDCYHSKRDNRRYQSARGRNHRMAKSNEWREILEMMTELKGIYFNEGLADSEVDDVEQTYGFRFPPDLRAFLQTGLPVGHKFPNWRGEPRQSIQRRLDIPVEGVLFDVERTSFWLPEWGAKPTDMAVAKAHVRMLIAQAPTLIPIYAHRMMPEHPHEMGNPVFSVHQTDIIYYGVDLRNYLISEFLAPAYKETRLLSEPRKIEFWDVERFQTVRWAT